MFTDGPGNIGVDEGPAEPIMGGSRAEAECERYWTATMGHAGGAASESGEMGAGDRMASRQRVVVVSSIGTARVSERRTRSYSHTGASSLAGGGGGRGLARTPWVGVDA